MKTRAKSQSKRTGTSAKKPDLSTFSPCPALCPASPYRTAVAAWEQSCPKASYLHEDTGAGNGLLGRTRWQKLGTRPSGTLRDYLERKEHER